MSGFPFAIDTAGPLARGFQLRLSDDRAEMRRMFESEQMAQARARLEETIRNNNLLDESRAESNRIRAEANENRLQMQADKLLAEQSQREALASLAETYGVLAPEPQKNAGGFGFGDPNTGIPPYIAAPSPQAKPGQLTRDQINMLPIPLATRMIQEHGQKSQKRLAYEAFVRGSLGFDPGTPNYERVMAAFDAKGGMLSGTEIETATQGGFKTLGTQHRDARLALAQQRETSLAAARQRMNKLPPLTTSDKMIVASAEKAYEAAVKAHQEMRIDDAQLQQAQDRLMGVLEAVHDKTGGILDPNMLRPGAPEQPAAQPGAATPSPAQGNQQGFFGTLLDSILARGNPVVGGVMGAVDVARAAMTSPAAPAAIQSDQAPSMTPQGMRTVAIGGQRLQVSDGQWQMWKAEARRRGIAGPDAPGAVELYQELFGKGQ